MDFLRGWLLSVTAAATILAAAQALMPEGAVKRAARLTAGLILILALVQPLVRTDYGDLYELVTALPAASAEELGDRAADPLRSVIEEELAACVEGKAAELGCPCTAEVRCTVDDAGVPVPTQVRLRGHFPDGQRAALAAWLEGELGLPREAQRYDRGDVS